MLHSKPRLDAEKRQEALVKLQQCLVAIYTHLNQRKYQIEKRFWVLKGPLQVHPRWRHKDERLVSRVLVLMLALLIDCLLEYLARQAQRQLTGRALLEAFAGYTVVLLRFADASQLWTFPELTALQAEMSHSSRRIDHEPQHR